MLSQLADHAAVERLDELDAVGAAQPLLGVGGRDVSRLGDERYRAPSTMAPEAPAGRRLDVHVRARPLIAMRVTWLEAREVCLTPAARQADVRHTETLEHVWHIDGGKINHANTTFRIGAYKYSLPLLVSPFTQPALR
jgi:hypothetical protein